MTTIRVYYKDKWKVFVLIKGRVPDYAIINMAMAIDADPTIPHDHVAIVDELNDEILWDTCSITEYDEPDSAGFNPYDYEPANIDSDMGFDPYMGCFSDDC